MLWKIILSLLIIIFSSFNFLPNAMMFNPSPVIKETPAKNNIEYQDFGVKSVSGSILDCWYIPADNDAKYTILFCYGNRGNKGIHVDKLSVLHELGVNIITFDYRGYGASKGRPSEEGLFADAKSVYDYAINNMHIPVDNLIIYGFSLGGAVAIDLASKVDHKALITEGTFTTIKDVARLRFPLFYWLLINDRFLSINKIADINTPKLFLHSIDDVVVPFGLGKELFAVAKMPKRFVELRGAHSDAFVDSNEIYRRAIHEFLLSLDMQKS